MQIGDVIKITRGPLAGLHGQLKVSEQRALIGVDLHGRQVDVEMDLDWLTPAEPARRSASGVEERPIQRRTSA